MSMIRPTKKNEILPIVVRLKITVVVQLAINFIADAANVRPGLRNRIAQKQSAAQILRLVDGPLPE
jgi:hypothetical protein